MIENLAATLALLLVTDDALLGDRDPVLVASEAIAGGVTSVQLRLKSASDRELLAIARRMVAELSVPIFINDRLDVALAAGAAGVHLGADDLAPVLARRIAPPGFIIGASVGSMAEVERGLAADYWGVGPLHGTTTKGDAGPALGVAGATELLSHAGHRPVVVIGGVRPEDVAEAREAGFGGMAVVSGILGAADVEAAARRYR